MLEVFKFALDHVSATVAGDDSYSDPLRRSVDVEEFQKKYEDL